MLTIGTEDPRAVAAVRAIQDGNVEGLRQLLAAHPELVIARLGDDPDGISRTLLHVVTDWPGHFPNGAAAVAVLVAAGADVNAPFHGPHAETPLHWAASSDDVEVADALLDAGADIEAPGSVLGGGSPLTNATGFMQWNVARRLVERGARTNLASAAALGLVVRIEAEFAKGAPAQGTINHAFWAACASGQEAAARVLLDRGADIDWLPPWDEQAAPLDAAKANPNAAMLVEWLRGQGARSADATGGSD